MADDINLPNLVSHLGVSLDGLNGTIADATRQGSSIGAALGGGIQRNLRDLVSHLPTIDIDANSDEIDRDVARVRTELEELGNQRIGVDISIAEAMRRINELSPHLARLSDEHPDVTVQATTRQAAAQLDEILAAARRVDDTDVRVEVDVDEDRAGRFSGILGRLAGMAGSIGGVAASIGKATAAFGAAVPAAGALVTTLANIAPAAGVAVTGMAAVQLASGAVKLAAVGMSDALSAALDPSKAEDYAKALEKLSPEARKFAEAVHSAAPELNKLQQSVQDEAFRGLATQLERTGKSVLPVLRTNLKSAGSALNEMGKGVLSAGKDLADSGTLGKALGSASKGLHNLAGVPKVVVTSLGQIAAAAGPSFERLTQGAGEAAKSVGDRLSKAFKSGAMQKAIEHAIDLIKQFIAVGVNVGKIIGGIFNAMPPGGGGLVGVLKDVTGAIAGIVNTKGVQTALRTLFQTMATVGATVAPLLATALQAIAPVITALGPPIQTLVVALGAGLKPIIVALGPVLAAAATAIGALITAAAPLLPVIGQLVAALLPALTPLLDAVTTVFAALSPVIQTVAGILVDTLSPILDALPGIIEPLAKILAERLVFFLQLLGQILIELGPSLVSLGQSFGQILVAAAPLLDALAQLVGVLLQALMPILTPLIGLIGQLAAVLAKQLAGFITLVVVPALQFVAALLRGDFSGAMDIAKRAALNIVLACVQAFAAMPGQISAALGRLAGALQQRMLEASDRVLSAAETGIGNVVAQVASLPGRAQAALGGLGGALYDAGASLISGFIAGITSRIPTVQSVLGGLTDRLSDWKGPKKRDAKILTPAGRLLIEGFIKGIDGTTARLRQRLETITKALPSNVRSGIGKALATATKELEHQVKRRDDVLKKLAAAQKKYSDLVKARDKARSDITSGILQEANITTGRADVNSVSAITVGLQQSLKATKAFQANIARLKKAGLRSDLLQQIADAGVDAGGATAAALAKATPAELKKINDLQHQLAKSAKATGNTVGDALYGAGVKAAEGLVNGLKSQEKAIEKLMRRIAENMLKTTKNVHKTHSPSRAFHEIGVMDGEGLRGGLLSMAARVRGAARTMAGAALDVTSNAFAAPPSAGQLAGVYAGTGGRRDTTNNFHLYGSEASPDGILRALSWQGLVGRG